MSKEEWHSIHGYEERYEVSNFGRIKSLARTTRNNIPIKERIMRQQISETGYKYVILSLDGKQKNCRVHRLAAKAFLPNPENKSEVNHINEDKTDNRAENLEWVTGTENINYGTAVKRAHDKVLDKPTTPVLQIDKSTKNIIAEHPSPWAASRETGIAPSSIYLCCKGARKTAGGYYWKYK